jgi:hypothetical protein
MNQSNLEAFQREFCSSIENDGPTQALSSNIVLPIKMKDPKKPIRVHRIGHIGRMTESLGETFEACWWTIGDEDFFSVCESYILSHPSKTYNLSQYGHQFPKYLADFPPLQDLSFLDDLARFEWAFKNLFHSRQHQPVSKEVISSASQAADFKIVFGNAVVLLNSRHSVYKLWQHRKDENKDSAIDIYRSEKLLLYKMKSQIYVDEINDHEFALLKLLLDGASLGSSLEKMGDSIPSETLAEIFKKMIDRGIVHNLDFMTD